MTREKFNNQPILLPRAEAELRYRQHLQIKELRANQLTNPTLNLEHLDYTGQIKSLVDRMRFSNYLGFLEYEILLGLDTVGKIQDHIKKNSPCTTRISCITKYAGIDFMSIDYDKTLEKFIQNQGIQALRQNTEFQTTWRRHESETPKWSTYQL